MPKFRACLDFPEGGGQYMCCCLVCRLSVFVLLFCFRVCVFLFGVFVGYVLPRFLMLEISYSPPKKKTINENISLKGGRCVVCNVVCSVWCGMSCSVVWCVV